MRKAVGVVAAAGALTAVLGAGVLPAQAAGPPRGSTLVLTVADGVTAGPGDPARAVTLVCGADTASGSHPYAAQACGDLAAVSGDFSALAADSGVMCTMIADPVTVTVHGVWDGRRVEFEKTFGNQCLRGAHSSVYAF